MLVDLPYQPFLVYTGKPNVQVEATALSDRGEILLYEGKGSLRIYKGKIERIQGRSKLDKALDAARGGVIGTDGSVYGGFASISSGAITTVSSSPFRWKAGRFTEFKPLTPGYWHAAMGADVRGRILIAGGGASMLNNSSESYLLDKKRIIPIAETTVACPILPDGTVVYSIQDSDNFHRTFRWRNGVRTDLGEGIPTFAESFDRIFLQDPVRVWDAGKTTPISEFDSVQSAVGTTWLGTLDNRPRVRMGAKCLWVDQAVRLPRGWEISSAPAMNRKRWILVDAQRGQTTGIFVLKPKKR